MALPSSRPTYAPTGLNFGLSDRSAAHSGKNAIVDRRRLYKIAHTGTLRVSLMLSAAAELMAGDAKLKRIRVNTFLGSKFCSWEPNGLNAEYFFFVVVASVMSSHAENIA
jgi:hypothetical protein